ncbi:unnamed protein product [Hymenolepis diminuta]|uniref:Uncharacterized protein n=1 Tax=Hymenolepis diminuta TaxID=6216 RepID=A0A564YMN3_HYMDI|nr:unnamed protein product [Hymenolepis diminuta]
MIRSRKGTLTLFHFHFPIYGRKAYVKGFAQFSSSAGWIFIIGNLQLLRIKFFEHPALGSSFGLKPSFLKPSTESHLLIAFSFITSFP